MFLVSVNVRYLESVINPEEEVLSETVAMMGLDKIASVKLGRTYNFTVNAESKEEAENMVQSLAEKLLVNQAMETYAITVKEA